MKRGLLLVLTLVTLVIVVAPRLNRASSRIAFMGDSITQGWALPRANFGIFGQTTAQMLTRFPAQVANPSNGQHFREVVIEGGTNDVLLHLDSRESVSNLAAMVELARAANVEPILAEIPPILRDNGSYDPAVKNLNEGIVELAHSKNVRLVDYYSALEGHTSAFSDGVHLRRRGYLQMERALMQAAGPIFW